MNIIYGRIVIYLRKFFQRRSQYLIGIIYIFIFHHQQHQVGRHKDFAYRSYKPRSAEHCFS